ncbi:hypothetical protein M405DRAFT_826949 [Rhizopogon salebrosus TDB-379]|nr:hypothetical protein M405DRAFT_826949 [Rhizopogon salebrosus TDB-379]
MALHPSSTSTTGAFQPSHVVCIPEFESWPHPTDTFVDTRTILALGVAAGAVTLAMILRCFTAGRSKLTTDFAKVTRKVDGRGLEFDE